MSSACTLLTTARHISAKAHRTSEPHGSGAGYDNSAQFRQALAEQRGAGDIQGTGIWAKHKGGCRSLSFSGEPHKCNEWSRNTWAYLRVDAGKEADVWLELARIRKDEIAYSASELEFRWSAAQRS